MEREEGRQKVTRSSKFILSVQVGLIIFGMACHPSSGPGAGQVGIDPGQLRAMRWPEVESLARGTKVNFAMWAGDESRNRYFRGVVANELRRLYGLELIIVPLADAGEAVSKLLNEKVAGKSSGGSIDMIWINGENFGAAKQGGVLWGPFASALPNLIRYPGVARLRDFGTPIDDFEAPWQRAHFVLAWDTARFTDPPRTIPQLIEWIRANPGRFTYPAPPDFTGSVFLRHLLYHLGGGVEKFQSGFDEALFRASAAGVTGLLRALRPFLWRQGDTYPASPRELDRLFVNNEVDFTMSYGPSFASERIARGEFPPTVRTFVFDTGTIGNYNYLAIPFNSPNPAGALLVINHLMSVGSLIDQSQRLGSTFPLDMGRLSEQERSAVSGLTRGPATLTEEELSRHLLPEPDYRYIDRLEREWREKVPSP
ncbi:MAG: ABC transporter substrate-binding protein [Acidobacteria bacterium]|nr:ABC transporter substrate-binding protein [Acidobacteriota bacterium]